MKVAQHILSDGHWHTSIVKQSINPTFVLCFGDKDLITNSGYFSYLQNIYPNTKIISSSTAGEFCNDGICSNSIVATAIELEKTTVSYGIINISDFPNSYEAGSAIARLIPTEDLRFVFLLSDGTHVNGSELIVGINQVFDNKIQVAGGLAGGGMEFHSTLTGIDENVRKGNIVAIGFYGADINFKFGYKGGWSEFGPSRTITKSEQNILYEIDGQKALDLYKTYLGDYFKKLPESAMLFPLSLSMQQGQSVVRTILNIDPETKSMTFAGNMPEGAKVRLMKTTLDRLADAAQETGELTKIETEYSDILSIAISCVGRKIVFGSLIDDEYDALRNSLGSQTALAGFFSYGEISPNSEFIKCELHNQTMTIVAFSEQ